MASTIIEKSLVEYVHTQVVRHSAGERPPLTEETLWYAGGVLVRFLEARHLLAPSQAGSVPVLAEMYGEAVTAGSTQERISWLRRLGDSALFLGAIFPENFARRGIGKDYFVGVGGGAYSSLADQMPTQQVLYTQLASTFPRLMGLLAKVCEKEFAFDATDIVALYERWVATGDTRVKQQLGSLGIVPMNPGSQGYRQ